MDVVVTGIGIVSALGDRETGWKRLLSGESGIDRHQPFLAIEPLPLALIHTKPTDLITLIRQVLVDALQDANLTLPLPDCGVVIGSSRGLQANLEILASGRGEEGERGGEGECRGGAPVPALKGGDGVNSQFPIPNSQLPIPNYQFPIPNSQFVDFLPHMGAIAAAREIGATGPVLAPMAACATGVWTIARAVELIRTGLCDRVVAGSVEAPVSPLTLAGFKQMGALAPTGCYPFDRDREGFVLGEGGALLVLEPADLAKSRGAKIYGRVLGFGLTNDACYANAPDLAGSSAIAAIGQCLKRSNLAPEDIDFIHAHGTATELNDRHEALLIQKLFPLGVAVSSTKGATGHTLGASGALGAAFCLMSMKYGVLPPCTGLKQPEFKLDFVRLARSRKVRNAVCLSFGFGGQNGAIVFSPYC
ncbi:MAG: beta-ketoacyl-ACP synthase [Microcoleus sp. SU_5_6]|nr:beta-ketoacyl-ACP synthase [Microcoleus sp. SU_5_6]NJL67708.1 beta-ketoacyl-ACP synthase [Microcoleus sp. SM1_3_4]